MNVALELYGSLILTVLGFILPIMAILLSLFPDGLKALSSKLENERKQSEENIVNETRKKETETGLDYGALETTLASLKKKKAQAEAKLEDLRPQTLIAKTAIPFAVAFLGVLAALQHLAPEQRIIAALVSIAAFAIGVRALFRSVSVLVEVTEIVSIARRGTEEKILELLSIMAERSGVDNLFLKQGSVFMTLSRRPLTAGEMFSFSVNKKYDVPVAIVNSGDIMAKKVQAGLILPKDVLLEQRPGMKIYTDTTVQIVRFELDFLQAHETNLQGNIGITFLRADTFRIPAFWKGENVKYTFFTFDVNVID